MPDESSLEAQALMAWVMRYVGAKHNDEALMAAGRWLAEQVRAKQPAGEELPAGPRYAH